MMRRGVWLWVTLACGALLLRAEPVAACGLPPPPALDPDPSLADDAPPLPAEDVSYAVRRGTAGEADGCSRTTTSCNDLGTVHVFITPSSDEPTPIEELGFILEVVDGEAPDALIPEGALQVDRDGSIALQFIDGASDEQEVLAFSITVTVMDAAGNLSDPSDPIRIYDAGSGGGCRTARGFWGSAWPGVLLMLGVFMVVGRVVRRRSPRTAR